LPSDLHWNDVGFIAVIALIMALIATLYPELACLKA
jgi:ABC-type lipoprotein release transport system permease subunit